MIYPILAIQRSQSSEVLLRHQLNDAERALFQEMDQEAGQLPASARLDEYHAVAVHLGARHGLKPDQSIAFFTRTTFREFEPR